MPVSLLYLCMCVHYPPPPHQIVHINGDCLWMGPVGVGVEGVRHDVAYFHVLINVSICLLFCKFLPN